MEVLDLFSGGGGLSLGFKRAGFSVTGVDKSEIAGETFKLNNIGDFILADLSKEFIDGYYDLIIGGPPCKPWSTVNIIRRDIEHPDYVLLSRFFEHIRANRPRAFLMENVPALRNTAVLEQQLKSMIDLGYSVSSQIVRYGDFGAPTMRRRLIVFGSREIDAGIFFMGLLSNRRRPSTVRNAIGFLRGKKRGEVPDHEWPEFKTIKRYMKYYRTGKYGWYILKWDSPSPSFGNIMKTYILHPDSLDGGETRVISVREAWSIMGFDMSFRLPENTGMFARYQMAADSVSPHFSFVAARVIKRILDRGDDHAESD